jgi:CRP-like cAMP-binding protein
VVLDNLASGLRYIPQMPALRSLVYVLVFSGITAGLFNAILLPFAQRAMGATDIEYSLFESIQSIGFVAGALLMVVLADRLHEGQWLTLSFASLGLVMFGLILAPSVGAAYLPLFMLGLVNAPNYVVRGLLVQRNVPRHLRGRVASIFSLMRHAMLLIGMLMGGLADQVDVRALMGVTAIGLVVTGLLVLVLPGLGQPSAEWRRLISMLRTAAQAPRLGLGRAASLTDILTLIELAPALGGLTARRRQELATQTRVYEAPAGTAILRKGEASDAAYFLLDGRAAASVSQDGTGEPHGDPRVLEILQQGDFFGEIAAINNVPRTADVTTELPSRLLQLPAAVLRQLMADSTINHVFQSKMSERLARLSLVELPYGSTLNQQALRELRTPSPMLNTAMPEAEPA